MTKFGPDQDTPHLTSPWRGPRFFQVQVGTKEVAPTVLRVKVFNRILVAFLLSQSQSTNVGFARIIVLSASRRMPLSLIKNQWLLIAGGWLSIRGTQSFSMNWQRISIKNRGIRMFVLQTRKRAISGK